MSEINGGNCRSFCLCAFFYVKETPQRVINFIYQKVGKLTLPKDIEVFLKPSANLRIRTEVLTMEATVRVRYSKGKIEEKIAEAKNYELSDENKELLFEYEKSIPLREKKLEKPDENYVFFRVIVRPRFPEKNLIRIDTLGELLKSKEIKDVFGLMEDIWPKPFHMTTCVEYEYEARKFKPTGGLLIPTQIPLPAEIGTRFGKSELDGISIRFKESAMGLEYIQISLENDTTLVVGLRASYELTLLTEMLRKAYELSNEIANFLVEKVK